MKVRTDGFIGLPSGGRIGLHCNELLVLEPCDGRSDRWLNCDLFKDCLHPDHAYVVAGELSDLIGHRT